MTRALVLNLIWSTIAIGLFWLGFSSWAPIRAGETVCGKASFYGVESCVHPRDCRTANGERFTGQSFTAAMIPTSHIGERWLVTYVGTQKHPGTGKSVVVRINDTGGFAKYGRTIDLSLAAARKIGMIEVGVGQVCMTRL